MEQKQVAGLFLEIFAVVAVLGSLAAVAIPQVFHMVDTSKAESREIELHNIQTAVTEMILDSYDGKLIPVGPTADMNQVLTSDSSPLVLADYLTGAEMGRLKLGCTYLFSADGTVSQLLPQ